MLTAKQTIAIIREHGHLAHVDGAGRVFAGIALWDCRAGYRATLWDEITRRKDGGYSAESLRAALGY
jgi:hypothetical protein